MRVIAGEARGRPLQAPRSERTRPTGDKIKGAIFSMLEAEAYKRGFEPGEEELASAVAWPRVLDLYAGSGALGIEALSRGARSAEFVDVDPQVCRTIHENLRRTRLEERGQVHAMSAEQAVQRLSGTFDLVLLDPPYTDPGTAELLEALGRSSLLSPTSVIVLEHGRDFDPPRSAGAFRLARGKVHGATAISLYSGLGAQP